MTTGRAVCRGSYDELKTKLDLLSCSAICSDDQIKSELFLGSAAKYCTKAKWQWVQSHKEGSTVQRLKATPIFPGVSKGPEDKRCNSIYLDYCVLCEAKIIFNE